MGISLDNELLIPLVEKRPELWDNTLEIYKDRNNTKRAWREICVKLVVGYEELSETLQISIGKDIIKRWNHLRDAYMRSCKNQKEAQISASGVSTRKNYQYHKELQFLNKITNDTETVTSSNYNANRTDIFDETGQIQSEGHLVEPSSPPPPPPPSEQLSPVSTFTQEMGIKNTSIKFQDPPSERNSTTIQGSDSEKRLTFQWNQRETKNINQTCCKKKPRSSETEERFTEGNQNRYLSFFKRTLPSVQEFQEQELIELQKGVLELIGNIKRKQSQSDKTVQDNHQQLEESMSSIYSDKSKDGKEKNKNTEEQQPQQQQERQQQPQQQQEQQQQPTSSIPQPNKPSTSRKRNISNNSPVGGTNFPHEPELVQLTSDDDEEESQSKKKMKTEDAIVEKQFESFAKFVKDVLMDMPMENVYEALKKILEVVLHESLKAKRNLSK